MSHPNIPHSQPYFPNKIFDFSSFFLHRKWITDQSFTFPLKGSNPLQKKMPDLLEIRTLLFFVSSRLHFGLYQVLRCFHIAIFQVIVKCIMNMSSFILVHPPCSLAYTFSNRNGQFILNSKPVINSFNGQRVHLLKKSPYKF